MRVFLLVSAGIALWSNATRSLSESLEHWRNPPNLCVRTPPTPDNVHAIFNNNYGKAEKVKPTSKPNRELDL
jgi:hypothetical protein